MPVAWDAEASATIVPMQADRSLDVVSDPEISGGTPVFRGTRVPVKALFDYLEGGETLDRFLDQFPSVSRTQALATLELVEAPSWPVRVLLDEDLPRDLVAALVGHQVTTVQAADWSGTKNGDLLQRAHERFDVLVTMDRGLQYQQNLTILRLSVLVIRDPSNRMIHLKPIVGVILKALEDLRPGELREAGV